jgi:hypothetical protein
MTTKVETRMKSVFFASQPATRPTRKRPSWLKPGLLWFAFDLLAPTGLVYLLLWHGFSLYLALLASALLSAISSIISFRRGRGRQRFAPYMLALSLAGLAVALITGSDRFLLAKESMLTAIVGCWFLASIWRERPLTYQLTKAMLEGRGPGKGISWEDLWRRDPHFRHIWRVSSVLWAVVTFLDAIIRVVMAYTLPVDLVPALQTGLLIFTGLLMQVVTGVYYARTGLWSMIGMRWGVPRQEIEQPPILLDDVQP